MNTSNIEAQDHGRAEGAEPGAQEGRPASIPNKQPAEQDGGRDSEAAQARQAEQQPHEGQFAERSLSQNLVGQKFMGKKKKKSRMANRNAATGPRSGLQEATRQKDLRSTDNENNLREMSQDPERKDAFSANNATPMATGAYNTRPQTHQ